MSKKYFRYSIAVMVISMLFTVTACKSRKQAVVNQPTTEIRPMQERSVQELMSKLDSAEFKAVWINAKASVSTIQDGSETSFNITMRSKRDSIIWISISPLLGIEVARVMITTDSVKFIDRLHGKYQVGSFENINKILQLKANFELVQSLLFGNFFAYKKNENRFNSVYLEDKYYILSSLNKKKLKRSLEEKDLNKSVIQDVFIDDFSYRIKKMQVNDQKIDKVLITDYEDFRVTDAGLFPFKSATKIEADKSFEIKIEYGKVAVGEPQEFPFNVPANYERIR
jgi:hypothetical protein